MTLLTLLGAPTIIAVVVVAVGYVVRLVARCERTY